MLLAGNLVWTTLCLGGYRPETIVVTGSLTAALLALHLCARVVDAPESGFAAHPAGWLFVPFLIYAAVNVARVSPVPWLGWLDWFGWAQMLAAFWVALNGLRSTGPRRLVFFALIGVALVAVWLGGYQRFARPDWLMMGRVQAEQFAGRASGSFGIPNSLAALLLLLLPVSGALAFQDRANHAARIVWIWITLVLATGLVLTISRGAWIGLALALTAWPLTSWRWSWRGRIGFAVVVALAIGLASGVLYLASPKIRERSQHFVRDAGELTRPIMWRASWQLFRAAPAFGTGGGSYNVLFERHRPERFSLEPQWTHNDYLNTLSDYGAVGFMLFFGPCGWIAWRCARRRPRAVGESTGDSPQHSRAPPRAPRALVTALAIGLLAFALQLFVDFHFKIPALAMACATLAAFVVAEKWPARSRVSADVSRRAFIPRRLAGAGVATGVVALWVYCFLPLYRAEAERYRARQLIDRLAVAPPAAAEYRAQLSDARVRLSRALALNAANAQAWADSAYATALWGHVEAARHAELGREAEVAADRAIALGPQCHEFWIRRGVARDMQGRWFEAGADFARALTLASSNALAWYYQAEHLSRRPATRGPALAALEFCLRLDPQNHDGLALRQRLAITTQAP